jgi:hypothetical protein
MGGGGVGGGGGGGGGGPRSPRTLSLGRSELKSRDFVVIRTDKRYSVGRVQEIYSDGSAHMTWWNTKDGKCNPAKKWYRAYIDPDSGLGECYTSTENMERTVRNARLPCVLGTHGTLQLRRSRRDSDASKCAGDVRKRTYRYHLWLLS